MQDLVAYVAAGLVDHPEAVEVSVAEQDEALLLRLRVAEEDLGKVIGRQGRTARALRTVISAVTDKRVRLEIMD